MTMLKTALSLCLLGSVLAQRKKMILNVDGSVEDAKGVLLALSSDDTQVLGVVCTASYITALQCAKNMDRIRRLAEKIDVPIFLGSSAAIIDERRRNFAMDMGSDAFGEYPTMEPVEKVDPQVEKEFGAMAIARLARENREEGVVVVVTGPLTDIALAIRLDEKFGNNIKALYVLGGNMFGVGTMAGTPAAEYNFFADPEAAYIVFNSLRAPVVMIPHETVFQRDNNEMYDLFNVAVKKEAFLKANSTKATFLREVSTYVLKELRRKDRPYTFGDEIAVAAAIRPTSVIDRIKPIASTIELFGQYTRGQVAIDWMNDNLSSLNVRVVTEYSPRAVSTMMVRAVAGEGNDVLDRLF